MPALSSIAEFCSRNSANEVIKGTEQKVSAGGTPHVAPVGYVNIRELIDGRASRTVALDEEPALVRWAFEAYTSGDYTHSQLADELRERGLTQPPTANRAARPLPDKKLRAVLHNRYYLGFVTWRGIEYTGKHAALVSPETFVEVQRVLAAHRLAGERSWKHKHYLSGALFCARLPLATATSGPTKPWRGSSRLTSPGRNNMPWRTSWRLRRAHSHGCSSLGTAMRPRLTQYSTS
jgi:site-specific DNA recombinase